MTKQFSSTNDLLLTLRGQINNRETLYNLCLTNRTFNDVFSRQLYKSLWWDDQNIAFFLDEKKRRRMLEGGNVAHTQAITIFMSAGGTVNTAELAHRTNDALLDIIRHTSGLTSFTCCRLQLREDVMIALSETSNLQHLDIQHPLNMRDFGLEGTWESGVSIPSFGHPERYISRFKSLRNLSLLNIWGSPGAWTGYVLETLIRNPQLQYLSLSIGEDVHGRNPEFETQPGRLRFDFEKVCKRYSKRTERVLCLKSLRLGRWIRFPDQLGFHGAIDFNTLEDIYIYNHVAPGGHFDMPWDLLSSKVTPNLRQVHVFQLELHAWRRLLPMITIRHTLTENMCFGLDTTRQWSADSPQGIGKFFPGASMIIYPHPIRPVDLGLTFPKSYFGRGLITHLVVRLAAESPSRLTDPGTQRRLEILTDGIFEVLKKLPKLEALWAVERPDTLRNLYNGSYDKRDLQTTISRIGRASSNLRYLRIGNTAWRIGRPERPPQTEDPDMMQDEVEEPLQIKDPDLMQDDVEEPLQIEALDMWENELEGPAFFRGQVLDLDDKGYLGALRW